jgi:5-methylcytosine-specific restriction endonuclease McrA
MALTRAEIKTRYRAKPAAKAHEAQYDRKYKVLHREKIATYQAQYQRRYKAENAEQLAESRAAYEPEYRARPETKELRARKEQRRRARKRNAKSEPYTFQQIWERDEGICGICGLPALRDGWQLDHIIPLGPGDDTPMNVRVTHPACNRSKIPEDKRALAAWKGGD